MIIRNKRKLTKVADNCSIADSFLKRLAGLMGKPEIPDGYCLIITPCNSIHMFFMCFNLDIVFLDKNKRVLHIIENLKPWRISKLIRKSVYVLELKPDSIKSSRTEVGDILEFLE